MKLNKEILKIFEDINFLIDNDNEVRLNKTSLKDKSNLLIKQGILETYKEFIDKKMFIECLNLWQETNVKYLVLTNEELKKIIQKIYFDNKLYTLNLNWLDTLNITDMYELFCNMQNFNGDISEWNTSNVKSMIRIFYNVKSFNLPIGDWDVSNVEDMLSMFSNTKFFNLNISKWDVSNVKNMKWMFHGTKSFNLPIGNWDVSNVENMLWMFEEAESFNLDISKWNVSNANTSFMFEDCFIKEEYKPKFK